MAKSVANGTVSWGDLGYVEFEPFFKFSILNFPQNLKY